MARPDLRARTLRASCITLAVAATLSACGGGGSGDVAAGAADNAAAGVSSASGVAAGSQAAPAPATETSATTATLPMAAAPAPAAAPGTAAAPAAGDASLAATAAPTATAPAPAPAAITPAPAPEAVAVAPAVAPAPATAVAPAQPAASPSNAPTPAATATASPTAVASTPTPPQAAAPAPTAPAAVASASTNGGTIPLAAWPDTLLQVGRATDAYWLEDGVWAPWGLTRGGYTGTAGTNYEQYIGTSPDLGPNGEVAFRISWKWPTCCNEIKSFPSIVSGRKPGWYNTWTTPGGLNVRLPDGSTSQAFPSGATPGTFLPLQLPIASLKTSFSYQHLATPTGRGHLAYDIFLQNTPNQASGFGANITHEVIIPLDYWGGYGQYPTRNPQWYDHDVTIDGMLFHVYVAKDADGALRPTFNGGWKFIIFEPDRPIQPGTLDLAKFLNYTSTRRDALGVPWTNGNEYAVSVELGIEPELGTGDVQVSNYRVWK